MPHMLRFASACRLAVRDLRPKRQPCFPSFATVLQRRRIVIAVPIGVSGALSAAVSIPVSVAVLVVTGVVILVVRVAGRLRIPEVQNRAKERRAVFGEAR